MFLENKADVIDFVNACATQTDLSKSIVYAFDKEAEETLIQKNIPYKIPDEVISFSDYKNIDKDSIRFAEGWYKEKGVEISLMHGGVSMGSLIQRDMAFFISTILDAIILSQKIIQHENPCEIYYFKRSFDKAAQSVRASKNETYYGYFSKYFTKSTVGLKSSFLDDEDSVYPKVFFVDYVQDIILKGKNILWVNDFNYLDVIPALINSLNKQYNIKHLKTAGGGKEYCIENTDMVPFDFSVLKDFFKYQGVNFFDLMSYKLRYCQLKVFPFFKSFLMLSK